MRKIIIIFIMCLIYSNMKSQSFCGSVVNEANALKLRKLLKNVDVKNYNGQTPMVRLALHNVVQSNGTGGNSWTDIRNVVDGLADYYEPHDICFTVISEDNIPNDDFFNLNSFFGTTWENLIQTNTIANAINIYFVANANAGGRATGFLFVGLVEHNISIPTVSLSNTTGSTNTFSSQILAHEIGHCIGLWHTHETINDKEEIPRTGNQANCMTAGDELCDTPADPGLELDNSNVSDANCQYIGGEMFNGSNYAPDTRNVMSYTLPHCMEWFSTGQGDRMRNFILNSTVFDDYVIPDAISISGNIDGNSYYGTELTISSTANHSNGEHVYEAGNEISLEPGFSITATPANTFNASIKLYSCLDPLVANSGKRVLNDSEAIEKNRFTVLPNPSKGKITVSFSLLNDDNVKISIVDISGKETQLYNAKIFARNDIDISFDLSDYSKGLYLIHLVTSDSAQTERLVIK